MRKSIANFLLALLLGGATAFAEDVVVPTVLIENTEQIQNPINPFKVFKTEVVAPEKLKEPQRQTLADLVDDQVGVDAQVYCANCGAKRLTINGLKGEHTSILVDGLPLHSAVSSFYGVDNVPVNGLAEVQVMRGAGASLTNPEAIGGTLNLVTVNPLDVSNRYSTSIGVDDTITGKSQNHSVLYTMRGDSKNWGVTLGGQFARNETWDVDKNNVSEMPQRQNYSAMAKTRFLLGSSNDFSVRIGRSELEILGGYFRPTKPNRVRPVAAEEADFVDGSVEKPFIGDPLRITDWIDIDRTEAAITGTHYLNQKFTLDWRVGYARQEQQAIYQHGFDYSNIDSLVVGDTHIKWLAADNHIFKFGTFVKYQKLRSASEALFEARDIKKDSFDFSSNALYAQYSYLLGEVFQLDVALRADHLDINWLELSNQVSETVLAPRIQALHNITDHLSQRLSYGLGYRAPMTFFESQHGNNEGGYEVDITELEKAHSIVYSLSWNTPDYYLTGGAHYTHLENMAYGFESQGQPIFYRNTTEDFDIFVGDILAGFKPVHWWLLEGSIEFFNYQDGYKRKLPTAAIEKRIQFKSNIEHGPWTHLFSANIIGSRDLSRYGSYNEHYVNRNQAFEDSLDPNLELKNQKSPTFVTFDTSLTYEFKKSLVLSFGINNIFNYTQAGVGDNPSAWHWHFTHAHFDGLHTWGPNTGRQYYLTVSGDF